MFGLALSIPMGLLVAFTGSWRGVRERRHLAPGWDGVERRRAAAGPCVGPAAEEVCDLGQLRRAAAVVRVFAGARFDGEREAAYCALHRIAEATGHASRSERAAHDGPIRGCPGGLYRSLTQGGTSGLRFDAGVCEDLDRRDERAALAY